MSDTPQEIDKKLTEAEQVSVNLGVSALMGLIIAANPVVANPFINMVVKYYVTKLVTILAGVAEFELYILAVIVKVHGQQNDYVKAAVQYKENPSDENKQARIEAARRFILINSA